MYEYGKWKHKLLCQWNKLTAYKFEPKQLIKKITKLQNWEENYKFIKIVSPSIELLILFIILFENYQTNII